MDLGAIFRDLATEGACQDPPLAAVFRLRGDGYLVVGRNGHRRIVGTHESVDGIDVEHEALRLEELAAKRRYDDEGKDVFLDVYPCEAITHVGIGATWETLGEEEASLTEEIKAGLVDGSGYAAQLLVRRDFGCVLHEAKP